MSDLSQVANQVLDETESTNDWARKLGDAGFPHGTWVSARVQTAGRGRSGRRWESQAGNLFLSMVARGLKPEVWTWIPLATACAATSVVRSLYPSLDLRIKWPNDLWLRVGHSGGVSGVDENGVDANGKTSGGNSFAKIGGILCEASSFVVIGLGLNCSARPEVDQATTSLSDALGKAVTADDVRAEIIAAIIDRLDILNAEGPAAIKADFDRWCALPPGSEIEWGSSHGTIIGLGPSSELKVRSEGRELSLYAEDVKIRPRA